MSSIASALYGDLDMTKVMYGQHAIHVPINLICQPMGDGNVIGVFQTSAGLPMLYGSSRTHVLILGDAIIRPRIVMGSDAFRGRGFSSLAEDGFISHDDWIAGDHILSPTGERLGR